MATKENFQRKPISKNFVNSNVEKVLSLNKSTCDSLFEFKKNFSLSDRQSKYERLINKNGIANIYRQNIKHYKYISDFFNTVVDLKWKFVILLFISIYFTSWAIFTIIWYYNSMLYMEYFGINCVAGLEQNYYDFFLFTIETQQTIGYGTRAVTSECGFSAIILMVQCGCSIFLECILGGVLFAKLSKPRRRIDTLIFSKVAVVAKRDGVYCFMCRVGDLRKAHIILARVHLYIIKTRYTKEGEMIPCDVFELSISKSRDCLLFMPLIIEHQITENSPLYQFINSANSDEFNGFKNQDFEILITLEGTIENTGASIQGRSSFLPHEIEWNRVFEPLTTSFNDCSKRIIDFSKFNSTLCVNQLPKLRFSQSEDHVLSNEDETYKVSLDNQAYKQII